MNRMIGVALSSVLVASLIAVGASQVVSRGVTAKPSTDLAANPITISGIVGTEKGAYFADPAVKAHHDQSAGGSTACPAPGQNGHPADPRQQ